MNSADVRPSLIVETALGNLSLHMTTRTEGQIGTAPEYVDDAMTEVAKFVTINRVNYRIRAKFSIVDASITPTFDEAQEGFPYWIKVIHSSQPYTRIGAKYGQEQPTNGASDKLYTLVTTAIRQALDANPEFITDCEEHTLRSQAQRLTEKAQQLHSEADALSTRAHYLVEWADMGHLRRLEHIASIDADTEHWIKVEYGSADLNTVMAARRRTDGEHRIYEKDGWPNMLVKATIEARIKHLGLLSRTFPDE